MKRPGFKGIKIALPFLLLLIIVFQKQAAAQNGLIAVMSYDDAEEIAVQSVRRASGIMVKEIELSDRMKNEELLKQIHKEKYLRSCFTMKELQDIHDHPKDVIKNPDEIRKCYPLRRIRTTDKLDFLGITDEFRLAALRRYIVRNIEIGVLGVWGIENGVAQPFIMSGKQLEGIETSTTVADLAKKIQASAAIPFLSFATAEQLVRNCRYKITGKKDQIKLDGVKIADDLGNASLDKFNTCMNSATLDIEDPVEFEPRAQTVQNANRHKFGVRSIKVIDNEGDTQFYFLKEDFKNNLKNNLNSWKYNELLENLTKNAYLPSDDEFLAAQIVINSLLAIEASRQQKDNKNQIDLSCVPQNKRIDKPDFNRDFQIFKVKSLFSKLRKCAEKGSVKNTLTEVDVDASELETVIVEEIKKNGEHFLFLNNTRDGLSHLKADADFKLKKPLKDWMTIEDVIEIVEKTIEIQMS